MKAFVLSMMIIFNAFNSYGEATPLVSYQLMSTVQDCSHPGHQPTWCDLSDVKDSTEKSGIVAKLISQLDRALAQPTKARVYAAEFSFSNKNIQAKLCELGKAGAQVQVYLDYSQDPSLELKNCQQAKGRSNYQVKFLGGFTDYPDWRLHHNKTILVDTGDGTDYDINFASGNLSVYGTSLHLENWVMMKASPRSNIARATECLFEGLQQADAKSKETKIYDTFDFSKDPLVMGTYRGAIEACYQQKAVLPMDEPEQALAAEGIAPFFTPNDGDLASRTLVREIGKVTKRGQRAYIYIAMEHFTMYKIYQALQQAVDSGVDVRIVMNAGTATGATEVQQDVTFYENYLKDSGMKIRFIETNPGAGGSGQQMHNKFTILNGVRIFSGAGHFTGAGLETNYETLYLSQDQKLSKEYGQYFKKLWDASVDEQNIKAGTVLQATTPEVLNSDFLNLVK